VNLEKGIDFRHAHFGEDETLPFEVVCPLGKGGFGNVDKVISWLSYREFARKKFRKRGLRNRSDVASFKTELMVLKRLRHKHCVELASLPGDIFRQVLTANRLDHTQIRSILV
jgi:serine/threonine protein kinase